MPRFSRRSKERLYTCVEPLIQLAETVIEERDITITCGHRDEDDQNEAWRLGRTTKRWPYSKHNQYPSTAFDFAPYPVDWNDHGRFAWFAGWIMARAQDLGFIVRWGGDWDRDTFTIDHRLVDMPHIEYIGNL